MWFLPSRDQWRKWSLPSKLTAIGAYVGIVSIPLAIALFALPIHLQGNVAPPAAVPSMAPERQHTTSTPATALARSQGNETKHSESVTQPLEGAPAKTTTQTTAPNASSASLVVKPKPQHRSPGQYLARVAVERWEVDSNQLIDMFLESVENDPDSYLKFTFVCRNSTDRSIHLSLQPSGNLYADQRRILTMDPVASVTDDIGTHYAVTHTHPDDRLDLGNAAVTMELFPHTETAFHLYFEPIVKLAPKAITFDGSFYFGFNKQPHRVHLPEIRLAFFR